MRDSGFTFKLQLTAGKSAFRPAYRD